MRSYPGMRKIKAATAFEVAEPIVPQLTPFLGKAGSFVSKKFLFLAALGLCCSAQAL